MTQLREPIPGRFSELELEHWRKEVTDRLEGVQRLLLQVTATTPSATAGHTHLLAAGATDVNAAPAELNLLDLGGLTAGEVLIATGAASAAWGSLDLSDLADKSHTVLTDIGTNTHAAIDTHIADGALHFLEGAIDHGSILGLSDDDHTQYILVDGSRAFTGNLNLGDFNIFNVGNIALDSITSDAGTMLIGGGGDAITLWPLTEVGFSNKDIIDVGDLGLGTSSPAARFHIHMDDVEEAARISGKAWDATDDGTSGVSTLLYKNEADHKRYMLADSDYLASTTRTGLMFVLQGSLTRIWAVTPSGLNFGSIQFNSTMYLLEPQHVLRMVGKIAFTQADENEFLQSQGDGYMDYSATTAHRFRMSVADTDVRLEFVGTTNSGLLAWLEDEDVFLFYDDIVLTGNEVLYLRDAGSYIYSSVANQLDLVATGDIFLNPGGNVKFGTHAAIGAETVTGYITIKDSGGTTRKLAVVS